MDSANSGRDGGRDPQGFPVEILDGDNIDNKFLCTICKCLTKNVVQGTCGHRFCDDCINHKFSSAGEETVTCPGCMEEDFVSAESFLNRNAIYPDAACRRELARLPVHCCFNGCSWRGLFKDFEKHCEDCQHFPMECPVCRQQIARSEYTGHVSGHSSLTSSIRPGDRCPFGCGQQIGAKGFEQHIRSQLAAHVEAISTRLRSLEQRVGGGHAAASQSMITAISRAESQLLRLQNQLQTAETSRSQDLPAGMASMSLQTSSPSSTLQELIKEVNVIEQVLTVMSRETSRLTDSMSALVQDHRSVQQTVDSTDRMMTLAERKMAMNDMKIAELNRKLTSLEMTSCDGRLLWKISEVARLRQEAISGNTTSVLSPAFYTSRTGYKMYARVYLNGDGLGKATHLSVYFVVGRSDYDMLLQWPFRQKVSLTLMDLANGVNHISDTFRPDPTSASFQRPTTEMNIASGCPRFAPLTVLNSPNSNYVKDNEMFIKVTVDCQGL